MLPKIGENMPLPTPPPAKAPTLKTQPAKQQPPPPRPQLSTKPPPIGKPPPVYRANNADPLW